MLHGFIISLLVAVVALAAIGVEQKLGLFA